MTRFCSRCDPGWLCVQRCANMGGLSKADKMKVEMHAPKALAACTGSKFVDDYGGHEKFKDKTRNCCYAHKRKPIGHCAPEGWCVGYPLHCGDSGAMIAPAEDGYAYKEHAEGHGAYPEPPADSYYPPPTDVDSINAYCDKYVCESWCTTCCLGDDVPVHDSYYRDGPPPYYHDPSYYHDGDGYGQ